MNTPPQTAKETEAIDWRHCFHDFRLYFGTIKRCRKCRATVAVSMDGEPKQIWSPLSTLPSLPLHSPPSK